MIAVACPFCMQMLDAGLGSVPAAEERGVQVFDLAELLDKSITYSKPAPKNGGPPPPPAGDAVSESAAD